MKKTSLHKVIITAAATLLMSVAAYSASIADYPELENYVGSQAVAKSPKPMHFASDGLTYMMLNDAGTAITRYDTKSGKEVETVFDVTHTRETTLKSISSFEVSADGGKILVCVDKRPVYRRSFTAQYYVYELRSRLLKPLSTEHPRQQAPLFSPDGRMVAFVADNNIYIKKLDYGSEVAVTTDGAKDKIINGAPDWTYEEEFTTSSSMTWSPDNLTLCFLKYNESDVPKYHFQLYEGYDKPMKEYALYPGTFEYKYPVAGEPNSVVSLHSYDVETRKTKEIVLPDHNIEYIPRISYAFAPDRLMVTTLNRDQNRMEIYCVNPRSTTAKSILVEQSDAWLPTASYESVEFFADFFVIQSARTGYTHLYQYAYTGALQRTLTSGNYDVTDYYGYDAASGCHFYQSDSSGAINRVLSKVDAKGKVTDLTPAEGTGAITATSPVMNFFVQCQSSSTAVPVYSLMQPSTTKAVRTLEDNADYAGRWASSPRPEFFTFEDEGNTFNGYIIQPEGFNPSKRYPVIMSQYSGPDSQSVLNRWSVGAENYFAKAGYVVVCVDGRGTGGRGRAWATTVYRNLGHYETIDQIAAARYAASLPFVDPARIAIYGWSYGGYEAIMAASAADAPYAAAVAVAPVTDWRYYDTVYAERFMLTPGQNADGYRNSSTLRYVSRRKCPLLIMHGTADDNVHLFNTISYSSHCIEAGTWCDTFLFPNKNHSILGSKSRAVVYGKLLDYLATNMK